MQFKLIRDGQSRASLDSGMLAERADTGVPRLAWPLRLCLQYAAFGTIFWRPAAMLYQT